MEQVRQLHPPMSNNDCEWEALAAGLAWIKQHQAEFNITAVDIRGDAQNVIDTLNRVHHFKQAKTLGQPFIVKGKPVTKLKMGATTYRHAQICLYHLADLPFAATKVHRNSNRQADLLCRGHNLDKVKQLAKVTPSLGRRRSHRVNPGGWPEC